MKNEELLEQWIQSERNQTAFSGWDFAYLDGRVSQAKLPWEYLEIVKQHLRKQDQLLDIGTGGGEFLQRLDHPYKQTAVTEGWKPNYRLLLKTLKERGTTVQFTGDDYLLAFPANSFDVVINRHAACSFDEVRRVLRDKGWFISQQVGDLNGFPLRSRLSSVPQNEGTDWHLSTVVEKLKNTGFEVVYANEAYPIQNFYDMDALIYYVKTIPWEYSNFSVRQNFAELLLMNQELLKYGVFQNTQHRFIFAAQVVKD